MGALLGHGRRRVGAGSEGGRATLGLGRSVPWTKARSARPLARRRTCRGSPMATARDSTPSCWTFNCDAEGSACSQSQGEGRWPMGLVSSWWNNRYHG
jgi:hypothetical protein